MNDLTTPSARERRIKRFQKNYTRNPILWGLLAAFLLAALITAYLTYAVVRQMFVQNGQPVQAAVPPLNLEESTPEPESFDLDQLSPLRNENGPTPRPRDKDSRVNILVMGLDYGDIAEGSPDAARSDSMLLFTMDPQSQTAGMLSIPRDLWVDIPGFGYGKINTAHYLGEIYNLDGSGPGLAMKTLENLLDLEIHYYAVIDFAAFEDFIDELGGIVVDVPFELTVDPIGPGNTVILSPGVQTMSGPVALAYARNRETVGSDYDRAQRQQQVILAIRQRILDLDLLPDLIRKSPIIFQKLASGLRTNLSLKDTIELSWQASQIEGENIKRSAIGPEQVEQTYSPEGMDILLPKMEEVLLIRDTVFTNTGPALPAAVATVSDQVLMAEVAPAALTPQDLTHLSQDENARVEVLNGTTQIGLAAETSDFLQDQGLNVTNAGNAEEEASFTTIVDYSGKPYTIQYLIQLLQVQPSRIYNRYDPNSQVDITIILGYDWVEENPLP
jgi:polyisoprenyl-teichoic acid--peptidoglycan teichoic acid transferase